MRRGLPRVRGGEPWPPADAVAPETAVVSASPVVTAPATAADTPDVGPETVERPTDGVSAPQASPAAAPAPEATGVRLRRGLPRVAGGAPWPPVGAAAEVPQPGGAAPAADSVSGADTPDVGPEAAARPTGGMSVLSMALPATGAPVLAATGAPGPVLRRGLPRLRGGEGWPPAGTAAAAPAAVLATETAPLSADIAAEEPAVPASTAVVASATGVDLATPLPFTRTVFAGAAPRHGAPAPEPSRIGPFTKGQWAGATLLGGLAALILAAMAVAAVRWFLSLDFMRDFLTAYPGEYHLPEGAPVGFPAWVGWQHFFNVFLMVLIIRTGWTIRNEKRPTTFWTPRGDPKGKTSLTIWFHQALDVLWLVNGVIFVVLLFATGQWMRVIPTSWEVIPNALSAALQYVSLDWPTENGWANYNALQQLAYGATIFLAAPLAAVTGFRMSGMWPKKAERLSRAYPIEWARKVHFPVMLYFVAFIIVHVFLVLSTGALRNLNHMYAAQGSVDPNAYADNWTGFWMFVASLIVIAATWVAARPMTIAPIARLFGTVSGR